MCIHNFLVCSNFIDHIIVCLPAIYMYIDRAGAILLLLVLPLWPLSLLVHFIHLIVFGISLCSPIHNFRVVTVFPYLAFMHFDLGAKASLILSVCCSFDAIIISLHDRIIFKFYCLFQHYVPYLCLPRPLILFGSSRSLFLSLSHTFFSFSLLLPLSFHPSLTFLRMQFSNVQQLP